MADLIQREDSLNTGREKLNNAIKAFNEAVVEGDSSVEAAQARVDEKGRVHPTLKARIDDGMNSVNSQLAQTATKEELYRESNAKADKSYVDGKVAAVENRIVDIITTPTDSVNAEEIIDSREGKDSLGDNIRDIRSKVSTGLLNVVENGNFSKGFDGFFMTSGTQEIIDGNLILTGNSGRLGGIANQIVGEIPQNQVWYFRTRMRALDEGANWLAVGVRATSGTSTGRVNDPEVDKWYTFSHYINDFSGLSGNMSASVYSYWPDGVGKRTETDYIMAFNLTETFGRGNEPTQEEMDLLFDNFGYFEGDLGSGRLSNYLLENQQKLLEKQQTLEESIERVKESELEDIITNGNFEENRDHWTSEAGTISNHIPGWIRISGVGSNATPRITQEIDTDYKKGDILYVSANFLPQNTDVSQIGFAIYSDNSTEADIAYLVITGFEHNQVTKVSGNITVASDIGNMRVQVRTRYPTAVASDGKAVDVTGIKVYNLTKFFGKGNEPTAEAFERMLSIMDVTENNKTDLASTQKAITQYILERVNSIKVGTERKPLCLIEFDDGNMTDYTHAFPFLRARGIRATSNIAITLLGRQNYMGWNELHELKNAGWDIEGHTYNNTTLPPLTDEEIRQEMEMSNQAFLDNGFGYIRHETLVGGVGYGDERIKGIVSEYRKTLRNVNGYPNQKYNSYDDIDWYNLWAMPIDMREDRMDRVPIMKNMIVEASQNNGIIILVAHRFVESNPGAGQGYFEPWAEFIDFVIDQDFEFVTRNELYLRLKRSV